jgi:hypothetical protein
MTKASGVSGSVTLDGKIRTGKPIGDALRRA